MPLTDDCSKALVKMSACSLCRGLQIKSCYNYCSNVMKGCLAHHTELNNEWNSFVGVYHILLLFKSLLGNTDEIGAKRQDVLLENGVGKLWNLKCSINMFQYMELTTGQRFISSSSLISCPFFIWSYLYA